MREPVLRLALRAAAAAIVIAAIVDPVMVTERRTRAIVAVVPVTSADHARADGIVRMLSPAFDVVMAPLPAAAATVLVGARDIAPEFAGDGPVIAVTPGAREPWIGFAAVSAPAMASADAAMRVGVSVAAGNTPSGRITFTLEREGIALERFTITTAPDRSVIDTAFVIVPAAPGVLPLRVVASLDDTEARAAWDIVTEVREERWPVLVFDRRPSWMSTFVRRALEQDPRFVVTHRVLTARELSRGAGNPPSTLADVAALSLFDVIVVGAPDALTADDVAGLESVLRRQGGAVVLLQDSLTQGGTLGALTGVRDWREFRGAYTLADARAGAPPARGRVTHLAVPSALPAIADVLATAARAGENATMPVLWRTSVGAGQLIVSGMLDQWRYRDAERFDFNAYWPSQIAAAAGAAIPAIITDEFPRIVAAGTVVPVAITSREGLLGRQVTAPAMQAVLSPATGANTVDTIRLAGGGHPGRVAGELRAPSAPGAYHVRLTAGAASRTIPLLVVPALARDGPLERERLDALTAASGGGLVSADRLRDLPALLENVTAAPAQRTPWHPMRSPWWILPLALALGTEWWLRRRAALP